MLLKAIACDDIGSEQDASSGGKILIRLESLCDQADKDELDGVDVPPTKKGYVRMEVQGGFVVRSLMFIAYCLTLHNSPTLNTISTANSLKNAHLIIR